MCRAGSQRGLPCPSAAVLLVAVLQGCAGSHGSAGQSSQSTRHEPPVRQEPPPIPPGLPAAPGEYDLAAEVLHYDLELALGSSDIMARARVTVAGGGSREIPFDFTGLLVRSVAVDGRSVDFVHDGGKLIVPLEATRDTVTVEIRYAGTPDDGLIIRTNSRGRPSAFADNWPNRTRFWLPSIDHPADKATAAFTVHAPAEWEVVANGRMLADPEPTRDGSLGGRPGMRTWRWETRVPQPSYTLVVGATDFHIESVGRAACGLSPATPGPDGCIDVTFWVYAEDIPFARRVFGRADQMVDYFAGRFGPYPFEKLAHVQSATRFGGMENSSAIFYSEEAITTEALSEGTVSHEVAHQWFGDSATQSDWSHLWLSEGFATYFGNQFFEVADGEADFLRRMEEARQSYLASEVTNEPIVSRRPPSNLFQLLNANNYEKGGWVLHMLRGLLGDDTFFAGVRSYYARYALSNADTDDFRHVLEETSDRPLQWFFDQWLLAPGYPVLDLEWQWDEAAASVRVDVRQVQRADWPTFRIPTSIRIVTGDTATDTEVEITEREFAVRLPAPARPDRVIVDPEGWILKGNASR